ncbi:MAG: carboxypeptidase regulatory-like domain-containing protein, partial [Deltaproteobacteria bacterium]|nr:carboxypeptidase regulatory-like domain-containing protein [Deltaproteobacteria bacterium]
MYMRFRNGDIYLTPAVYDTIVLDRCAPTNTLVEIAGGQDFVTDAQVALRLQADDALSGVAEMRIAVDSDISDETWDRFVSQRLVELAVPDLPDGELGTVLVQFRDGAGNASEIVSDTVLVDEVAPANAALTIANNAPITASRDVLLTLSAFGAREMRVSNDSGLADAEWQPYASAQVWRLTDNDEQKTVYAQFRDGALNQSEIVQDGIELNTRGNILGAFRLEGAAANGHADITVELNTTPPTTTVTSQDGSFSFSGVTVGAYSLTATKSGYQAESWPYLEVRPGEATDLGVRTLSALRGGLSGVAQRQDAAAGEHGGIVVEVTGSGKSTVTNAMGEWMVEDLLVAQYTVRATAEGYVEASASDVPLVADVITAIGTLVLASNPGSIIGAVTLEGLGAPGLNIAEVLVAGQTVPCAEDGGFEVQGVRAGAYSLLVRAPGFASAEKLVTVAPGLQTTLEPIALSVARGDLTGSAELESRTDYSGILIVVQGTALSAVTGEDGYWTIRGVPVGQYTIRASASGFNPAMAPDINVIADGSTEVPLLSLTSNPGSVVGSVELEGELAGAFAGVLLTLDGSGLTALSTGDGSFNFPAVPSGAYSLTASMDGFGAIQRVVTVQAGIQTDVALITLSIARGAIEGTATLVGMDDHSGITVELDGTGYAGVTSSDGNFRINAVPVGAYTLTARKEEYLSRTSGGPVQVEEGKTTFVALGELGRQQGDFVIEQTSDGQREYLREETVTLVFGDQVPDLRHEILASEAADFAGATWQAFDRAADTHAFLLTVGDPDGTRTVYVKFRDDDVPPVETAVFSSSAILDRVPPLDSSTITINGGADFSRDASGLVTLSLTGLDATSGVDKMVISIDDDDFADDSYQQYATTEVVALAAPGTDGLKTVYVRFMDRAGNQTAASTDLGGAGPFALHDQIYLDTEAPGLGALAACLTINDSDGDCTTGGGAAYSVDALVTLSLAAEDACTPDYPGGCAGGVAPPAAMLLDNDGSFPAAAWEPYVATRAWFLTPGDSTLADPFKEVFVKYRDAAGNETVVEIKDEIALDRQSPSGTATIVEGAFSNSVNIELRLTGSEDSTRVCVYGDAELTDLLGAPCDPDDMSTWLNVDLPVDDTVDVTLDGAADGVKIVKARLGDPAGNRGGELVASTTLDTRAPDNGALLVDGDAIYATATDGKVDLTLFASDPLSGVAQVQLSNDGTFDGNPVSEAARDYLTFVDDWVLDSPAMIDGALRTVYVRFGDRAGNWTFPAVVVPANEIQDAITLDNVAPTADDFQVSDDADGDEATIDLAVALDLAASGASTMKISHGDACSGGSWEPYATTRNWTLDGAGDSVQKYASVIFRDQAGNLSGCLSDDIYVDTQVPSGTLTIVGGAYHQGVAINLDLTGPADAAFVCVYGDVTAPCDPGSDPAGWAAYAATVAAELSVGDGAKIVRARIADAAGNRSQEMSAGTFLDTVDPVADLPVVGDGGGYVTSIDGITSLDIRCTDFGSGVAQKNYRIDGGVWQTPVLAASYLIDLGTLEDSYLVETQCIDHAGRLTTVEGLSVMWDKTPPTVSATIQGPDFTNDPVLSVQITGDDGTGSGLLAVAMRDAAFDCDAALYQEITSGDTLALPVTGDGSKTAHLCAMDFAGNRTGASTPSTNSVTVDTLDPSVGALTLAGGAELVNSTTAILAVTGGDNTLLVELWGDLAAGAGTYWYGPDQDGVGGYDVLPASVTLGDANGLNVVNALFADQADNDSNSFSALITVDTTKPADGTVTLAGGQDPVDSQTIAVTIEDTAPDTMRFWEVASMADCGDFACDTGGFVPFVPATSHTFLTSIPETKRVCWKFCDEAGNDSNVGFGEITLVTVDERPVPVLEATAPSSYTALSREYEAVPPDPLYPLTLSGRGIAADTKAEVGDFLLDCVAQGSPDGSSCKADSGGGCAPTGGDCETYCATACVVALPPEIMKYSGTYVVRLVSSAPVEGSGVSDNTEFFTVVAPRPEVDRIWPRGIEQLFDAGSEAIAQDVIVEVEGRNWMDNVLFRLGGNYGTVQSLTTDATTGAQVARVTVSTVGQYDSSNAPSFMPTIVALAAVNSGTGGGEDSLGFGLNPRVTSWTDDSHGGSLIPVLRPTEISAYPNANVRRVGLPRLAHTMAAAWTGENGWAGSRDDAGKLITRISRTHTPAVTPLPLAAQWCDMEDSFGDGSSGGLRDGVSTGPLYWSGDATYAAYTQHDTDGAAQDIVAADLDGNGTPDLVKIDRDNDRVGVSSCLGDGSFGPPTYYQTGDEPYKADVGDVDGDGLPDLLVGCNESFTLRLNTGTGFGNPVNVDMGWLSGWPKLADLNNDGKVDVVSYQRIRLGNGDGTFQPAQDGPPEFNSPWVIADLNGDSLADVVSSYSNEIYVFLGKGDGSFHPRQETLTTGNVGPIRAADANGDGVLDLYTCDYADDTVSVLLGLGDGSFGAQVPYSMGDQPSELIVADLDGDHVPDVLSGDVGAADRGISIRLGNADGTLGARSDFDVPFSSRVLELTDLNRDGVADLLIDGLNAVYIKLGNVGQPVHAALSKGSRSPYEVALADFDRDGSPDIAAAELTSGVPGGLCWHMGNGDGSLDDGVCLGANETHVAVSDLDGDGIADAVVGFNQNAFMNV